MAHKSKTQRAKATAAKANRKEREERDVQSAVAAAVAKGATEEEALEKVLEEKKAEAEAKPEPVAVAPKEEKPKKKRFQFLRDVKAEMKRVTWPTRTDVLRWSGVVVAALVFFGVYVAILDNLIVTPALVALSGLGA